MRPQDEQLFEIFERLLRARNECSCKIFSECGLSDMTVTQISYLKTIDEQGRVTFSRLAEITRNSKPTVSEMINKFVRMDCVYREPSPDDGRVLYISLTEKGRRIAQAERYALRMVIEQMMESLDEREKVLLARLLEKVG
ncbi:DNA-binding MarR family transcriptional regulator [Methanolinea mesophila]|uniref:MarR family winged helix-turn-helix transcriptional regulator n=1 Tax=Methanolinea mesophila TaxID=547055 RepID=UPI001AE805CD|nr:MarR family transcriptional regulator [Methanolinea mesophila]MBP1929947.1 DNA-binding MarR family transcriptional regulator [Methanolinea mesophila]